VGTVFVENRGECAYVGRLAVLPELQGRGYGRALLEHAEAIACGDGEPKRSDLEHAVLEKRLT
jgi:GNAT superfamily N-acetyltransferase